MVSRRGRGYRYARWHGGPDPLAPPYDLGSAVDEIGDSVLGGSGVREALRELLRRGMDGRRGLDELRRSVRDRLRHARQAGRMDGTLQEVRELLDRALDAERRGLVPDPGDPAPPAAAAPRAPPEGTPRPAWPRPSSTRCRRTPPAPSGRSRTTRGDRRRRGRPTSRSRTCCAARCSTAPSPR